MCTWVGTWMGGVGEVGWEGGVTYHARPPPRHWPTLTLAPLRVAAGMKRLEGDGLSRMLLAVNIGETDLLHLLHVSRTLAFFSTVVVLHVSILAGVYNVGNVLHVLSPRVPVHACPTDTVWATGNKPLGRAGSRCTVLLVRFALSRSRKGPEL